MPLFPSIKNKNMAKNLLKVWMADNTVTTDDKTDKIFVCFCEKGRRICLFKTRKEKNLPVAF